MTAVNHGVRRNPDIEEATNLYFIHPLSARLVPLLVRIGVHPNTVSITGALCGAAAGVAYYHQLIFLGFALMIAWHVFDGADGQLARLTNKMSPSGQVIDGVCDYVTFGAIYLALALTLLRSHEATIIILVVCAAASHAVQAAAFERQREVYLSWAKMAGGQIAALKMSPSASVLMRVYENVQRRFMPLPPDLMHTLRERAVAGEETVGSSYRAIYRRPVKLWSLLSANNRSIAIFIAFLMNWPEGYLWFEAVALNLLVMGLLQVNAAAAERLRTLTAATA